MVSVNGFGFCRQNAAIGRCRRGAAESAPAPAVRCGLGEEVAANVRGSEGCRPWAIGSHQIGRLAQIPEFQRSEGVHLFSDRFWLRVQRSSSPAGGRMARRVGIFTPTRARLSLPRFIGALPRHQGRQNEFSASCRRGDVRVYSVHNNPPGLRPGETQMDISRMKIARLRTAPERRAQLI